MVSWVTQPCGGGFVWPTAFFVLRRTEPPRLLDNGDFLKVPCVEHDDEEDVEAPTAVREA